MKEKDVASLHDQGVILIEHGWVHPQRVVDGSHPIPAGVHAVVAKTGRIHDLCVCFVDHTHAASGLDRGLTGDQSLCTDTVHAKVVGMGLAYE